MMEQARQVLIEHIAEGTTPGATAVVVRRSETVATFAEGRHTYETDSPRVRLTDRYDLASLTKPVVATACMLLEDAGLLSGSDAVSEWVPGFRDGGREAVTVEHLLTHTSGLPAHRPLFDTCSTAAEALSAVCGFELERTPGTETAYSDLGFILLGAVLEAAAGSDLRTLVTQRVLEPLEMDRTSYRPTPSMVTEIPPTEQTDEGLIHGVVHDDNARAMGGVAPHAGLFGPAADLGRLLTAYLSGGVLEGKQVLPAEGVEAYTTRVGDGGRTPGWDTVSEEGSSAGRHFGPLSFGHLGFTGTSMWADPDTGIGIVLLTNRVHPARDNDGIRRLRPAFHDAVMEELQHGGAKARRDEGVGWDEDRAEGEIAEDRCRPM